MSETPQTLAAALAALQADLPTIAKSETANVQTKQSSYSYSYAGLASITEAIMPRLTRVGLSFTAAPTFQGDRFVLRCTLLHVSGEREEALYPLPTSGTPQAIGSAITYGRRYTLCAMTGVAPEDDDDGAAAEAEQQANRGTARRAQPRPAPRRQAPADQRAPQQAQQAQRAPARQAPPPLPGEQTEQRRHMITEPQQRKIAVLMREQGIDTRELALERVAEIIGRRVESRTDLTMAEAKSVIEALDAPPAEEPPADA